MKDEKKQTKKNISVVIGLRVTEDERSELRRRAENEGRSVSSLIRRAVLKGVKK